jgi:hypothetical protein
MAVLEMAVSAAVGYLGSLLGKVTEGTAGEVGKKIYESIASKFTKDQDSSAQETLKQLAEKPSDEGLQKALTTVLQEKLQDPAFTIELTELLQSKTIANQAIQQTFNAPVEKVVIVHEMTGTISF